MAVVDPNLSLRCPVCQAVDWFRDGFVVVELEEAGEIVRRRVMPGDPGPRTETLWSCARCAYEVPDISELARELDHVRWVIPPRG